MKKIYTSILVLACFLIAQSATAAISIYMRAYDQNNNLIQGESVSQYFPNWIELNTVSENTLVTVTSGAGGGTAGRPELDPIKFEMPLNSASLPILSSMYQGRTLSKVDIWFVRTGPQSCACAFYKIHMETVFITGYKTLSQDADATQQLEFTPKKIAWAYYKQSTTGSYPSTPTNSFGWDFITNMIFNYTTF